MFETLRKSGDWKSATDAAFAGIDLKKMEEEWKTFVLGMEKLLPKGALDKPDEEPKKEDQENQESRIKNQESRSHGPRPVMLREAMAPQSRNGFHDSSFVIRLGS